MRPTLAQRRAKGIAEYATAIKRHKPRKAIERELVHITTKIIRRENAAGRRAAR